MSSLFTQEASEKGSGRLLTAEILSAERRAAKRERGISMRQFSSLLGLRNHESLWRIEKGKWKISRRLARRFWEWKTGEKQAEIVTRLEIPAGTILPDSAEIARCGNCGKNYVRMNKARAYHNRSCQLKAWRRRRARAGSGG